MNRDLANGLVELVEFKVTPEMNIQGPVENIVLPNNCNLIAINRAGRIAIPKEGDEIKIDDHLMLLCDARSLPELGRTLHESKTTQKVMIVGGGMVGFYLASRLEKMEMDVKLIEQDADRCAEIADKLSGTMILNGDGSDLALLQEEGAGAMDVVYAVTRP